MADSTATATTPRSLAMNPRTTALLHAPLLPLLLSLAAPNIAVMLAQSSTGLIETYFVGKLGTDALAGMAAVFPGYMLMTMMSSGAMGGGISAAIARALGAGRRADADALVLHAVLINLGFGLAFTLAALLGGRWLYTIFGLSGPSLEAAMAYSNIAFGGSTLLWVFNALASAIRGTGNMALPAKVIIGGVVVLVPISPCLIFGLGPFPALGVAGGAVALVLYYSIGTLVLVASLQRRHTVVRLHWAVPQWRLFHEILRVGAVAILVSLQTYLTISFATAQVGHVSPAAVAGFGTGNRLEYLLIPLIFGMASPIVAVVGTSIGAGDRGRALRAAWVGAAVATAMSETVGLLACLWPEVWLGLFGHDPAMLAAGAQYLHIVGPFYGMFGLGLALYFASQGVGKLLWAVVAGVLRLTVAVAGGQLAVNMGFGLGGVFAALSAALVVFGLVNTAAFAGGGWFRRV